MPSLYLLARYGPQGWTARDARWRDVFRIDLSDSQLAPDGTMETFRYRGYLKKHGLASRPYASANPLAGDWHAFREERDDRAWKWLTDAIRAHAATRNRRDG